MAEIEKVVGGFEVDYDNSATDSYLVIKAGNTNSIIKYQAAMLSNNKINHIIQLHIKFNDGNCYCYYNITSKLPLHIYLKRKKLSGNEFIRILSDIAGTIVNSDGYLLSSCSFLVKAGCIYINPETLDIQLIYIPVKRQSDISAEIREMVIDMILNHIILEESTNGSFLQKILGFVRSEQFSVSGFYKFLTGLSESGEALQSDTAGENKAAIEIFEKGTAAEMSYSCELISRKESGIKSQSIIPPSVKVPGILAPVTKRPGSTKTYNARFLLPAVVLLQIAIAAAFLICIRYTPKGGNNQITVSAGLIMLIAAIEILVFRKLIPPGSSAINNAACLDESENAAGNAAQKNATRNTIQKDTAGNAALKHNATPKHIAAGEAPEEYCINAEPDSLNKQEHNNEINPGGNYNTVMLSPDMLEQPYLVEKYNPLANKIIIDREEFFVGRLKGQVDYVSSNNAVGKIHACITRKNGCDYITDLNSVNGTYIDGSRIDSNRDYEIKNNNVIAFANSEFVFISGR